MLDVVVVERGQVPMTRIGLHSTESLLRRIRSEFAEMPGLCLTSAQAARLWNLDPQTSQLALHMLVESGFLTRTRQGRYIATSQRVDDDRSAGIVG